MINIGKMITLTRFPQIGEQFRISIDSITGYDEVYTKDGLREYTVVILGDYECCVFESVSEIKEKILEASK